MADVQDDEQWLYGDDDGAAAEKPSEEEQNKEKETDNVVPEADTTDGEATVPPAPENNASLESAPAEEGGQEDKEGDSSDDDDLTVTIGELKKAAEVMTPAQQQHQARFQPKAAPTTGLKDDDFNTVGKVNGVPVPDLTLNDSDDKPWRKPGADLSDYFNYGFNEETWFKYCYRQKRMRVNESGSGLSSLGINISKPFGNIGANTNEGNIVVSGRPNRSNGPPTQKRSDKPLPPTGNNNTIQVMTADRREYSNKIMSQPPPFMSGPPPPVYSSGYDDMDFGGNAYMSQTDNGYGYPSSGPAPAPNFYNTPPPTAPSNNYVNEWSNPPPPIAPPVAVSSSGNSQPRWGGEAPPTPALRKSNTPPYRERESRDRDSDEDRRRSRRHRRSPSRSRHRSRSRSRSPSHKHKRKKSRRDRDD